MEKEILDSPLKEPSIRHSRLSFKLFLWTLAFFCIPLVTTIVRIIWLFQITSPLLDILFGLPVLAMMITSMGGFRHAFLSIRKNEPWVYQKVIGLIGGLVFVVFLAILILSNVIDMLDTFN
jgi:hypothetical protein